MFGSPLGHSMPELINGFLQIVAHPTYQKSLVDILVQVEQQLNPFQQENPKDHLAVAQNALEAYRNGSLTRDQAMKIVLICLEDDARSKGQVIDITAKRSELARLFN